MCYTGVMELQYIYVGTSRFERYYVLFVNSKFEFLLSLSAFTKLSDNLVNADKVRLDLDSNPRYQAT